MPALRKRRSEEAKSKQEQAEEAQATFDFGPENDSANQAEISSNSDFEQTSENPAIKPEDSPVNETSFSPSSTSNENDSEQTSDSVVSENTSETANSETKNSTETSSENSTESENTEAGTTRLVVKRKKVVKKIDDKKTDENASVASNPSSSPVSEENNHHKNQNNNRFNNNRKQNNQQRKPYPVRNYPTPSGEGITLQIGAYSGSDYQLTVNTEFQLGTHTFDVTTVEKATATLSEVDNVLSTLSAQRSNAGAQQGVLQDVSTSLNSQNINLQASYSSYMDTDYAAETARYTEASIMQNTNAALLIQMNTKADVALSLLTNLKVL